MITRSRFFNIFGYKRQDQRKLPLRAVFSTVYATASPLLSSLLIFYRPSKTQTPPTPFPSRPVPCPPRSVEQLMLDLVLKNVKQTQRNNKQSKTHRFAPRFYLPSPNLGPLPAVLCCDIAKEPKMLDRFRRGTSKQQSKFTFASSPLRC